ncbi:phospholipase A1-IIgamma-like [Amaranthus tricolor]|uniref:phospholipase A1-IIgamma-like n=1 Tax=Amaranthus tricolor TaxID=29722 RepID=UPI00258E9EDC|nr:phospholipase A1-IIgamma-like [Amaranthus tricolor]
MIPFFKRMFRKKFSKVPTPPKWRPENTSHSATTSSTHGYIADKWEILMGQTHWENLLQPLDKHLRQTIIHYGEMSQASYDTFIREKYSKHAGRSRYSEKQFFSKLGLVLGHPYKYKVTKFFYATSGIEVPDAFIFKSLSLEAWSKDTNFMGYVAVADDESVGLLGRRDIVVSWRGSVEFLEWLNDFRFLQVSAGDILGRDYDHGQDGEAEVHQGWFSIYTTENLSSPFEKTSAREQVLTELTRLVEQYKNEEISITITGHSLGAALATLNAVDIVANKINQPKNSSNNAKPCMVTAILFACPRVGDTNFKKIVSKYEHLKILRIKNAQDVVPNYPLIDYSDVGEELIIDTTQSPYLKKPGLPSVSHNLEVYMHGVAGTQGSEEGFKLVVERDVALLNKFYDNLKDDYLVPIGWFAVKYKGMVQQDDGSWMLMDCEMDDDDT